MPSESAVNPLLDIGVQAPASLESLDTGAEVRIHHLSLDPPAGIAAQLRELLSPDEVTRADRFIDPVHGRRFTAGRAALRVILGAYTGTAPASLEFAYGKKGKPALKTHATFAFNLSHSADRALLALGACADIGVDIERYRDRMEEDKLALRYFSPAELEDLETLDSDEARREAFYAIWTRKESYMKAVGDGFSIPLKSFRVTVPPDEAAQLLAVDGDPSEAKRWFFQDIPVETGYRACVALNAPIGALQSVHAQWASAE